jgi:hypothetical protein
MNAMLRSVVALSISISGCAVAPAEPAEIAPVASVPSM